MPLEMKLRLVNPQFLVDCYEFIQSKNKFLIEFRALELDKKPLIR